MFRQRGYWLVWQGMRRRAKYFSGRLGDWLVFVLYANDSHYCKEYQVCVCSRPPRRFAKQQK